MSAFVVLLHADDEETNQVVRKRITDGFPEEERYEFSDTVYLITGVRLIDQVADKLGFADEADEATGVILRLNGSYQGRSYRSLWDWLRAAIEHA